MKRIVVFDDEDEFKTMQEIYMLGLQKFEQTQRMRYALLPVFLKSEIVSIKFDQLEMAGRSNKEVYKRYNDIVKDERYHYPDAKIDINAYLAIIQMDMKTTIATLKFTNPWIEEIENSKKQREVREADPKA